MTTQKPRQPIPKSAWRQHQQSPAEQAQELHKSQAQDLHEQSASTPTLGAKNKMLIEVRGVRFMNKENGFVIAYGKALSDPAGLPEAWAKKWNKDQCTLKGTSLLLADMNAVGTVVECEGDWVMDPKFGLQYQFAWARESMPSSLEALTKYLSAGRIKGIGPATAKIMIEKWGMDTLDVIDKNPERLSEISGMTEGKIKSITSEWGEKKASYQLSAFFGLYGVGEVWIPKIVEALGPNALESRIRDNPYLLTAVEGIGFATADKIALSLGVSHTSPKRVTALLLHLLNEYTSKQGYTACTVDDWLREAAQQLGLQAPSIQPMAQHLINEGAVVLRSLPVLTPAAAEQYNGGNPPEATLAACVSLKREYMHEKMIAIDLKRLCDGIQELAPGAQMILNKGLSDRTSSLDASQIEGVLGVLTHGVSVLTGGPGTGKTTTLKSVIDIAEEMGWNVVLAAPTGRAAKRMEEAIGRPAKTLHRTLKYSPKEGFMHNKKNPMTGDLFVVDEASMLDNQMASAWLRALPNNARVIFVGDIDQLPSVGAGNFLRDIMTTSACQVFRLTRVHRQAEGSLIAEAAQSVLAGRLPPLNGDPWVDDFAWVSPPNSLSSFEVNEFIQQSILSLVDGYIKKGYKREHIQVLSPQREGAVGVQGLNETLRWTLNEKGRPTSMEEEDEPFALGDRLLVTKNNYDKDVFNGDMGIVQKIEDDGSIELLMEDGKSVVLDRTERKCLTLGYAITVHKSQGGERPVIIMACSPSHTFSMNKNLIYTGITRGRNKVVVVGSSKTLYTALSRHEKMYRLTGLVHEVDQVIPRVEKKNQVASFQPKKRPQ